MLCHAFRRSIRPNFCASRALCSKPVAEELAALDAVEPQLDELSELRHAAAMLQQRHYSEAFQLLQRGVEIFEHLVGHGHPLTLAAQRRCGGA